MKVWLVHIKEIRELAVEHAYMTLRQATTDCREGERVVEYRLVSTDKHYNNEGKLMEDSNAE